MAKPNGKPVAAGAAPWALPSIEVHLDKPRHLSFPMPAIRKYWEKSGINVAEPPQLSAEEKENFTDEKFLEWLLGNTPIKRAVNLEKLCWAGLLTDDCKQSGADADEYWDNPPLKISFVAMHIGFGNTAQVLAKCYAALMFSLPPAEKTSRPQMAEAPPHVEAEAEKQRA